MTAAASLPIHTSPVRVIDPPLIMSDSDIAFVRLTAAIAELSEAQLGRSQTRGEAFLQEQRRGELAYALGCKLTGHESDAFIYGFSVAKGRARKEQGR